MQPAALKGKPTSLLEHLEHLTTPLSQDDSKEHYRERLAELKILFVPFHTLLNFFFFSLRCVLMLQIIRRLSQDETNLHGVTSDGKDQSLDHQFTVLWNKLLSQGWSDHSTTVGIDRLYHIGGATWLVTVLVKVVGSLINFVSTDWVLNFGYLCVSGHHQGAVGGKEAAVHRGCSGSCSFESRELRRCPGHKSTAALTHPLVYFGEVSGRHNCLVIG